MSATSASGFATALLIPPEHPHVSSSLLRTRPCDPTIKALKKSFQLEVKPEENAGEVLPGGSGTPKAPLASPEAFSETSSLASFGSESFRKNNGAGGNGQRRVGWNASMRMDPIRQSPLCRAAAVPPGSCRRISRDVELLGSRCEELEEQNGCLYSNTDMPVQDSGCPPSCTGSVTASIQQHRTVAEIHHNVDSPTAAEMPRPPPAGVEFSLVLPSHDIQDDDSGTSVSNAVDDKFTCREPDRNSDGQKDFSKLIRVEIEDDSEIDSVEFRVVKAGFDAGNTRIAEIEPGDDGSSMLENRFEQEVHPVAVPTLSQSDEDNASVHRQYLYDDFAGHYSQAGRGYPHGFCRPQLDPDSIYQSRIEAVEDDVSRTALAGSLHGEDEISGVDTDSNADCLV